MDHTKCKTFIAFRHTDPSTKSTYWIEQGWEYSEDTPGLFPYQSKADKDHATEMINRYTNNWMLNNVEGIILKVEGIASLKIDKIEKEADKPKRTRKKKNED